jgi:putative SOS response-associated peptidase YedK
MKTPLKTRAPKRPFLIRRPDRAPLGFAGLWEHWLGADGSEIETACIVTTHANGRMAAVHDRMPAILEPDEFAAWLDARASAPQDAMRLLRPAPDEALELLAIGPSVGKVGNDGPQLQTPLAADAGD